MRIFVLILSLFASAAVGSETDRLDQSARIAQECDEKVLALCETQDAPGQAEVRACIKASLPSLDQECRLVIDKQLRKEAPMGLAQRKSSKDTRAKFLLKKAK